MSDERGRPDSDKTRQELLDEIYYLRDVAGERGQRCADLADVKAKLDLIYASRFWRLTAPLRTIVRWLDGARGRASLPADAELGATRKSPPGAAAGSRSHRAGNRTIPVSPRRADVHCLFVDVSELALCEGRTGVQRVVREILRALLASPPDGFVVEPVAAAPGCAWRRAAAIEAELTGNANTAISDASVEMRAGDVFLGLDHSMQIVIDHAEAFAEMRARGVRIWFACNDTLPLDHPEWFPPEIHERFKQWFQAIARLGDGVACISRTTANDVRRWVDVLEVSRSVPLAIGCFAMGADIGADEFRAALTNDEQAAIDRLPDVPKFLLVGTLEPRKGHEQALEAFNQLRADGVDIALVIVGFPGWMTEVVQRRIRHHDEFGKKVFWFMDASDALLEKLYASCSVLLAPSQGEGFGLPLIEAARHGLPIMCRDLPVFREVAGEHAHYFAGPEPAALAVAMRDWLEAHRRGNVPTSVGIACSTWAESARQLAMLVVGDSAEDNAAARLRTRDG